MYQPRSKGTPASERTLFQLAVPKELRSDVLKSYHDCLAGGGHLGSNRTFYTIRQKFFIGLNIIRKKTTLFYLVTPAKKKTDRKKHPIPLTNMPMAESFERWHMDILGPLTTTDDGYQYILLVVDSFSRWSEAFPLKTQEAIEVATVLFNEIIARYGAPRILVSDRGKNFMSKLVSALCEMFDITRHHTSAYHPQTNSTCERLNSTIAQILRAYIDKDHKNWPSLLPSVMMACRMSPSTQSTGLSPFYLLFGKEMNLPIDTSLIPKTSMGLDAQTYFENLLRRLNVAKEITGSSMKIAQEKSKARHDKNAKDPGFKIKDKVLLKNARVKVGQCPKFAEKYLGPFYITDLGPSFTYKLVDCNTHEPLKGLVHGTRLKRYNDPVSDQDNVNMPQPNINAPQTPHKAKKKKRKRKKPKKLRTGKIVQEKVILGKKHFKFDKGDVWFPIEQIEESCIQEYQVKQAEKTRDREIHKHRSHNKRYFLRPRN